MYYNSIIRYPAAAAIARFAAEAAERTGMKNAKAQIRQQVLETLKSTHIHNIQVKAVTDALGISRSTFYLYYDSVYAVLQDIEDTFFEGLEAANAPFWRYPLTQEYMTAPHPVLLDVMRYLRSHRNVSNTLRGPFGEPMFLVRAKRCLMQSLCPPPLMQVYYPEDTELHVSYLIGGHLEVIHEWMAADCPIPDEEFVVKLYRLMFGNLFPAADAPSRTRRK